MKMNVYTHVQTYVYIRIIVQSARIAGFRGNSIPVPSLGGFHKLIIFKCNNFADRCHSTSCPMSQHIISIDVAAHHILSLNTSHPMSQHIISYHWPYVAAHHIDRCRSTSYPITGPITGKTQLHRLTTCSLSRCVGVGPACSVGCRVWGL